MGWVVMGLGESVNRIVASEFRERLSQALEKTGGGVERAHVRYKGMIWEVGEKRNKATNSVWVCYYVTRHIGTRHGDWRTTTSPGLVFLNNVTNPIVLKKKWRVKEEEWR